MKYKKFITWVNLLTVVFLYPNLSFAQEVITNCDSLKNYYLDTRSQKDFFITKSLPYPTGGYHQLVARINYPGPKTVNKLEGKVVVWFVVSETGKAICPEIIVSLREDYDEIVVKAILDTEWIPATSLGRNVSSACEVPILFSLQESTEKKSWLQRLAESLTFKKH